MKPNIVLNLVHSILPFSTFKFLLTSAAVVLLSTTVNASTVDEKVVAAQLVFEGVVVDVQTRFAERENESDPAVPYRFVTYNINRRAYCRFIDSKQLANNNDVKSWSQ